MRFAIAASTSGVEHAIIPRSRRTPSRDQQGRELYETLCGRTIIGDYRTTPDLSTIRCRPCKWRAESTSFQPTIHE